MVFSDFRWQVFSDTVSSAWACIVFYQGWPIDHCTHVSGTVSLYIVESDYISAFTAGMDLAHFRMLKNELLNNDPDVVP